MSFKYERRGAGTPQEMTIHMANYNRIMTSSPRLESRRRRRLRPWHDPFLPSWTGCGAPPQAPTSSFFDALLLVPPSMASTAYGVLRGACRLGRLLPHSSSPLRAGAAATPTHAGGWQRALAPAAISRMASGVTAPAVASPCPTPSTAAAAPLPLFSSSAGDESPLPSHRTQRPPLYTLPFYGSAADVATAPDAVVTAALRTYGGLLRGTPDERRARLAAAAAASFRPRTLTATGVVVSTAMDKSVNVAFRVRIYHRVLKMWSAETRKRMAHDEGGWAREGDVVTIRACRPLSKRKAAVVVVNYGGGGVAGGERGPLALEGALVAADGRVTVTKEGGSDGGEAAAVEDAGKAAKQQTTAPSEDANGIGENGEDRLVGQ